MSHYLAITGGVGGAKLALGLSRVLPPDELDFLVNTGDDFEHLGLHVSPDLDTLMYTLAGLANPLTGWGRVDESWQFIDTLRGLGGEAWFNLGDRDLAVHVRRSCLLREGHSLSTVTQMLFAAHGIAHRALPMCDHRVRTMVETAQGTLAFQDYFVRERCAPRVLGIRFDGAAQAEPSETLLAVLDSSTLAGIIICPSNPFLSVDPILAVSGLRDRLLRCDAPIIAVSPIIAGAAVKGPTGKIMEELALPQPATAVAAHYGDLIDGFLVDRTDVELVAEIAALGVKVEVAQSLMQSLDDRINLAHTALRFLQSF